ncbi:MAG: MFS transporter [Candidatus Omnitrophota bacterium]
MKRLKESFKNRNFFCLWLAQIISQFGDRINQMALIGLVAERGLNSTFDLAKLLSFSIIPVFIVGPIAGVYVDRWDRRVTLFVCDFLRGFLVLSIPFLFIYRESMIPIYVIVFLVFSLSRFYVPAKMSIIPELVPQTDLLMANSLVSTTGMIAFVLGCLFGGLIVENLGSAGGFFWDAVTFFASGVLVLSISLEIKKSFKTRELIRAGLKTSKEMIDVIHKSVMSEIKEGVSYLVNHKDIRFIISILFILFSAAGAVYVVIIVFIQKAFSTITRDLGFLAVFLGLGLFAGAILYGRFGRKFSRIKTMFFCLILGGLILMTFASFVEYVHNFALAALLASILGFVVGPIMIATNTVVHEVADERMLGKVFSSLEIVIHFAFLVSMLLSSFLAERIGHFVILMSVGVIFAFVGLGGLLTYKKQIVFKI